MASAFSRLVKVEQKVLGVDHAWTKPYKLGKSRTEPSRVIMSQQWMKIYWRCESVEVIRINRIT